MPKYITCPSCGSALGMPPVGPGEKFACPCGQRMMVPAAAGNRTVLVRPEDVPILDALPADEPRKHRARDDDDRDYRRDEEDDRPARKKKKRGSRDRWCSRCDRSVWTRRRKQLSQTSWILICVGIIFWPLIIVGLCMSETVETCEDCGRVLRVSGGGFGD